MRGMEHEQGQLLSYLPLEDRVRKYHPLRAAREMTDKVLKQMIT